MNNPYAKGLNGKKKKPQGADIYSGYNVSTDAIMSTVARATQGGGDGGYNAPPTASMNTSMNSMRPPTQQFGPGGEVEAPRPMTSVKAAGYTSAGRPAASATKFDPFGQSADGPAPPLKKKTADSPDHQAREMERTVNRLIEESAGANVKNDYSLALEKAKEAGKKERFLCRHREKHGLSDQINVDLTYAVCFNLANQYHAMKMYSEALNTYSIVVKNKQYPQAGRLRVNMGNIYYEQKKYPAAIKMYRMAMDLIGNTSREMRFKIMRNIGNAFVRLGQFQDAIQSFEGIMDAHPDAQTGFNLIICYYALGDRDKMKRGFEQLLGVQEMVEDEEEEEMEVKKPDALLKVDYLKKDKQERKKVTNRYIHIAAKLISPVIEKDFASGWDWIIEYLKTPRGTQSPRGTGLPRQGFPQIAMDMEISKGIAYLKRKNIKQAIEVFKSFERKDSGLNDGAATNLSFLYFLEGDMKNAEKYADVAVKADRYNAKALVNKANYLFEKGAHEEAKDLYLEAIGVEADCIEAIFNLGLAHKKLHHLDDALQAFKKLQRIVPKDPQVIWHIANLYDLMNDRQNAKEWFKILHGTVGTDPKVLARLGTLYNKDDDTAAFHNFSDSYNCYPVNMEVIAWLGIWFVKLDMFEDAIQFFERASEIEPKEIKWELMVASCYRRMGSFQQALDLYKKIHKRAPDNIECLRYMCSICKDLNDQSYDEYNKLLKRAERELSAQESKFMQDEVKEGAYVNGGSAEPDVHATGPGASTPAVSPEHHAMARPKAANLEYDGPEIEESAGGRALNTDNVGNDGGDDEWGDMELGDDLLPL